MQSFLLPKNVTEELDKVNKDFFSNKEDKYKPLISWEKICRSRGKGGLGIHKTEDFNQALQIKLLWKIITELQNLWVRIITEKYLKRKTLIEYEKKIGSNTS